MLDKAFIIADEIAKRGVEEVILFHSASGKDSIALLDILAPRFKRVVCVFMYIVKDMEHISRYIVCIGSRAEQNLGGIALVRFKQNPAKAGGSAEQYGQYAGRHRVESAGVACAFFAE